MAEPSFICIAGKNDIAVQCLESIVTNGWPIEKLLVVCNRDDPGKHTWQSSLRFAAARLGVREISLSEVEELPNCLFLSLEFDRIIKPDRFRTRRLFNLHFSKLPEYRGVHTAVWPILDGRKSGGVTIHRIDRGIDSGEIVEQEEFEIPLTWTSRDLYQRCMELGRALVLRTLPCLLDDTVTSSPQAVEGASYHGSEELDFRNPPIRTRGTASQLHNSLRAFTFWEYQLPRLEGREVLSSAMTRSPSRGRPGTLSEEGRWLATSSTRDVEVQILFNVYEPLFAWSRGDGEKPDEQCLHLVPDIDRMNRNGWNALMMAAWAGRPDAIQCLIESGANVNGANKRGTTPLMYAASCAERTGAETALELLLDCGADVSARDAQGLTLAEHLLRRGSHRLARLIESRSGT